MCHCDAPKLYDERIVRSREPRRCCECRAPIAKGDEYQRIHGLWAGEFITYKTCIACATTRDVLSAAMRKDDPYCCGPVLRDLYSEGVEFWRGNFAGLRHMVALKRRNRAAVAAERQSQPRRWQHER